MKKLLLILAVAISTASCVDKKPVELYVPKNTVEFAGNAFASFSLGADVKLFTAQNPDDPSKWMIQGVVPVRKEASGLIGSMDMEMNLLDDRGIRIRDGFVLKAEDLDNIVPVYNSGNSVENTIVFSVGEDGKKDFSYNEAKDLLNKTKGVRMVFNVMESDKNLSAPESPQKKQADNKKPGTLSELLEFHGIHGLLAQYDRALKNRNKSKAKQIEDHLWSIEKKVMADNSLPKSVRERFKDYIENKEDEIEDKY